MKEKLRKIATTAGVLSLMVCALALAAGADARGAAIVKATFKLDGNVVARTIYSGPDGGRGSDPATYWKLLGRAPMFGRDVVIKPDQANARVATLKGDIEVSIEIRNKFNMGVAKIDTLKLVRDEKKDPEGWHLPQAELKRLMGLVKPAGEKPEPKEPPQAKAFLESAGAGKLPPGCVIRVWAHLWGDKEEGEQNITPQSRRVGENGEKNRGVHVGDRFDESWQITADRVYRMASEGKGGKSVERRVALQAFDSRGICKMLLDGKALSIAAGEGEGDPVQFAGTPYVFGGRAIEILIDGREVLHLGESCAFAGYLETDALAFAALYDQLASKARAAFAQDD